MRRRFLPLLFALLLSALLVSCSSLSDLVRAQVEGLPSWVYSPQQRSGEIVYVGQGSSSVAYNARLLAYEDILKQIADYVGEDVHDTYYRELTTTNAIADLGLTIASEHTSTTGRLDYSVYLLARMDATLLSSKRTSVYNEMISRDAQIEEIVQNADQSYRSNNDTVAIEQYLKAAILASQGPVGERKHEVSYLLDKAQGFIEALRFSLRNPDSTKARVTVLLRRRSRLLSPRVLNANIYASFQARNSLGRSYIDSLQFNSATDGNVSFIPYNQGLIKSGSVAFTLNLDEIVSELKANVSAEQVAPIEDAIQACTISFPYTIVPAFSNMNKIAEIQEFSLAGELLPGSDALQVFTQEFLFDTVSVQAVALEKTDTEEQIQEIGNQADLAFLGSVGVASQQQIGDKWVVVASGSVQLHNLKTGNILYDTLPVEAVGSAPTLDEARSTAFTRFGSIAAYLQSTWLFKQ